MSVTEIQRERRELIAQYGRVLEALNDMPEARAKVQAALKGPKTLMW